jgi:ABC-type transporter Mla maintaining outer membrane lipid asymmetry ATPase subunit MlaF
MNHHEPTTLALGRESAERPPLAAPVPVLEMVDVSVGALKDPQRVVLEGVHWSVNEGDFWAIGGLHASGKSDFMALAAGLMPPLRGTFRVFGQEFQANFEEKWLEARRQLGLVFDGGQLLHHLTVAENVALPIRYHRNLSMLDAALEVEALLSLTGLIDLANHTPSSVTRNWQQRVGLARALALKPKVLLLDNPLTGLDPRDVAWWLDLLVQLSIGHPIMEGKPTTLVVSGDDLRPWKNRARQFGVLKDGKFSVVEHPAPGATPRDPLLHDLFGPPVTSQGT